MALFDRERRAIETGRARAAEAPVDDPAAAGRIPVQQVKESPPV